MKQNSKLLLSLLHGVGIGAVALTGNNLLIADASAGVSATRHNLGASGTVSGANRTTQTAEVCVFCHTPHSSNTSATAPPLWNKSLPGNTYKTYASMGSSTLDARTSSTAAVGGTSLACLSCHDGTQAIDNIINAPGPGGFVADGGGSNGRAWVWTGTGVNSFGQITNGATNLGTDLSNDHPIGIAYCGGVTGGTWAAGTAVGIGCRDTDFRDLAGSGTQFWVNAGTGGAARDKNDMYLYWRTDFTQAGPSVECGSCHDPHAASYDTANQVAFLRVTQSSSGLCLSCHNK